MRLLLLAVVAVSSLLLCGFRPNSAHAMLCGARGSVFLLDTKKNDTLVAAPLSPANLGGSSARARTARRRRTWRSASRSSRTSAPAAGAAAQPRWPPAPTAAPRGPSPAPAPCSGAPPPVGCRSLLHRYCAWRGTGPSNAPPHCKCDRRTTAVVAHGATDGPSGHSSAAAFLAAILAAFAARMTQPATIVLVLSATLDVFDEIYC